MVKLKDLEQKQERTVRESISTPTGTINIYEPTVEDFDKILTIQKEEGQRDGSAVVFGEATVIRKLFPLLTDLELGDTTDEELEKIVENPTIHLLAVQNVVSQIVAEVNILLMKRIKTELIQTGSMVEQASLATMIPSLMSANAEATGNDKAKVNLGVINGTKLQKFEE